MDNISLSKGAYYKYCIVPMCSNTTIKTPLKTFIHMPINNAALRKKWCSAMRRDPKQNPEFSLKSHRFVCEDHFDLENDMENYVRFRLQHVKPVMRKGVVPHIFACQKATAAVIPPSRDRGIKRKRKQLIAELLETTSAPSTSAPSTSAQPSAPSTSAAFSDDDLEGVPPEKQFCSIGVQVHIKVKPTVRSKATKTEPAEVDTRGTTTEDLVGLASAATQTRVEDFISEESSEEDSDSTYEEEAPEKDVPSEELRELEYQLLKERTRSCFVAQIEMDPKLFLGLNPDCYSLIQLLCETVNCPTLNILLTLKKIRVNDCYSMLSIHFGMSVSNASRIFRETLHYLAIALQELIFWPDVNSIRRRLPVAFRSRYAKVTSIIDCFEIEIEKPSNSMHQSLSWSSYYGCNTLKYLVSCTPDGLVTFVSEGYGGRASDTAIAKDSGYINEVPFDSYVMADRGFKFISCHLSRRRSVLVRPPSVTQEQPNTREEVIESKRIAALRIHVERVIGRIREFKMLLPNACVNNHFIQEFDKIVLIVCGLINIQSNIIKY